MSSSSNIDAEEEKRVKNIIDALKSEGLFDQFRRECLADVDTKPAYQNLRQRVEGYVSRFLSRQQWSPSLNKNQLRDNLRKQITASGMLANGVERVIEQVINPKILQLIKPKIDDVVCAHLGIDPKERQANLEKKQQQQKENLQSLMSINISQAEAAQTSTPTSFPGQQSTPSFSSPYSQALWTQQMPPQVAFGGMMPNFPMVPPFGTFPPFGMPPQMFPYWNTFGMFPQAIPGMAGIPFPPPMSSAATTVTASSTAGAIGVSPIPPIPSTPTSTPQTKAADTPTPPKSSFPPLPPTPPPPGTEDDEIIIPKEDSKDNVTKSLFKDSPLKPPKVLDDIPLPPTDGSLAMKIENDDSQDSYAMGILDDDDDDLVDGKRPYKFAWDEDIDIDNKSELSVSSVHTSDLSSFEDLESNSDQSDSSEEVLLEEDIEVPQGSPLSVAGDRDVDTISDDSEISDEEMVEVPQSTPPYVEKESPEKQDSAEQLDVTENEVPRPETVDDSNVLQEKEHTFDEDVSIPPEEISVPKNTMPEETEPPLPEQQIPPLPPSKESTSAPPVTDDDKQNKSPSKPQKLISLQYNYSDSEDEETREERKLRIAKEKEERYAKRAQRRAELEAKRKEREEERARLREERKKTQDKKVDESFEKGTTDSSERMERTSSIESSPEKMPSSPEKKKRKTKAELKLELTKQKVMEKKAALRRQRTRNRRYTSDEFTSIFTEKKQPFSSQSYSEVVIEEQTFEETVVTDNIEYVVDEAQNQTEYQTQEVCGSMEGEVILEDGRQLKVDIIMEDEPSSPATPTQDENEITLDDKKTNAQSDDRRRATSPLSDVSDDSLVEVPKGTKRKRQSSGSRSEKEPKKSQRYDTSDLYKPRPSIGGSRRRNSSPGAAVDKDDYVTSTSTKSSKSSKKSRSKSSRHSSRSRSVESGCQPSPISSSSLTSVHSPGSSSSRSRSGSSSSGSSGSSESGKSRSRSSSSGSSVDEFGRRKRRKGKMPIDMIDFGEAERMVEKNLYRVSFGEAEKRSATRRFQGNRGRGLVRGTGNWQRQNSWQYPPEGGSAMSWSPEGSPSKRYYYPEPGSSPYAEHGEMSPGAWDAESPPYYPTPRPRRTSQMEDSPPPPPHRPGYPPVGRRPQSPPPEYLRRSLSPSEHIMARGMSPDPWEESMSPPHSRGHRSQSPPYIPGRLSPSPPPYIPTRGQRSPSPGRPYVRARSPSPYRMGRVGRSPSPPMSRHSPSPPLYSPPHRPILRGRSPSPPPSYFVRRSPSPHRPVTRGQRSPSPQIHRRPVSPPTRPMTRGLSAQSPYDTRKKATATISPKVPMTNKLRNIKFGSPYQAGGRRNRGNSPERSKRGRH